ncbi:MULTISPECIES: GNAT family N-acetyltransferase [Gulbenkiania]|uniref:Ribosomal protein S18 acetylase RimI and related acetyltransferases n=2 Tax=Gulbenkiania TaxID=397456 RepID=A0A0K6GVC1_9NEIS|nr:MULTISPECIES: GNAT family N-acetyltransferase [Gulbenkiania]TCW29084.1 hypothetical protein EV669_11051 [Gulbenkiania mobilis]CUA82515.1 Ribosomal protein S18 acetylase RimI and related acetyltransferases [Gulbenkiania indica]
MSNLVIRRASFSDVPAFLALFVDYLAFYHVVQAPADCRRFLENRLKAGDAVVLLGSSDSGAVQGFALLYPGFSSLTLRPNWLLHDLFVAPAARGQGLAEALIRAAQEEVARQGGEMMLETAHDNLTAQSVYRRCGLVPDTTFATWRWHPGAA